MRIGGLQKNSMIDFPGHISSVIFTQGCPWRCPYCHNASLVVPERFEPLVSQKEVFAYLDSRKGRIDGVVISGGEPTLQPDLEEVVRQIKEMGFAVKLDSNGIFPGRLQKILATGLIDYVAIDVKATLDKLVEVVGVVNFDPQDFAKSMQIVRESGVPYEWRTTVCPQLPVSPAQIAKELLQSGECYYLQAFQPSQYNIDVSLTEILSPETQQKILDEVHSLGINLDCEWR